MTNFSCLNDNHSRFALFFMLALTMLPQPAWAQPVEQQAAPKEIALRVIDPDGEAIAGAEVTVRLVGKWTKEDVLVGEFSRFSIGSLIGKTDAKGRLVVRRPKEARSPHALIQLSKSGFVTDKDIPIYVYDVPPGQSAMDITLIPALSLSGVVVNEEGRPIPDVEILRTDITLEESAEGAKPRRHFHHMRSTARTDNEGKWKFDEISSSFEACEIRFFHPEYVLQTEEILLASVKKRAPDSPLRTLVMKLGHSIVGRVMDEQNQPIVGAQVKVKADDYDDVPRTTTTDEQGAYQLAGLKADTYHVAINAAGKTVLRKPIAIVLGTQTFDFTLSEGGKLKVQVVDEAGKPVAKARVTLSWRSQDPKQPQINPPTSETDAEGRWQWNEAPDENIRVDIRHSKRIRSIDFLREDLGSPKDNPPTGLLSLTDVPLIIGDKTNVIVLPKAFVMRGRVIDAETEQPIDRFLVKTEYKREGTSTWYSGISTGGGGGEISHRPEWRYATQLRYRIEAEGYNPAFSPPFQSDAGMVEHEFRLTRLKAQQLSVVNQDKKPAKDAQVVIVSPGNQVSIVNGVAQPNRNFPQPVQEWPTTDGEGKLEIKQPAGVYALLVLHDDGFSLWGSTKGPLPDPLTLTPWARVEGTFRVKDQPLAGVNIRLRTIGVSLEFDNEEWASPYSGDSPAGSQGFMPPFHFQHFALTDEKGTFEIERAFPGKGNIGRDNSDSPKNPSKAIVNYHIDLKPGETRRIDLGGVGRTLVGQLAWKKGEPAKVQWNRLGLTLSPGPNWEKLRAGQVDTPGIWISANAEEDGSFRIDDVPPGEYFFDVRNYADLAIQFPFLKRVTIPPDDNQPIAERDPVDLGTLTLEPAKRP